MQDWSIIVNIRIVVKAAGTFQIKEQHGNEPMIWWYMHEPCT